MIFNLKKILIFLFLLNNFLNSTDLTYDQIHALQLNFPAGIEHMIADYADNSFDEYNKLQELFNKNLLDKKIVQEVLSESSKLYDQCLKKFGNNETITKNLFNLFVETDLIFRILNAKDKLGMNIPHKLILIGNKNNIEKLNNNINKILEAIRPDYNLSDEQAFDDIIETFAVNKYNYILLSFNIMPRLLRLYNTLRIKNDSELIFKVSNFLLTMIIRAQSISQIPQALNTDDLCNAFEEKLNKLINVKSKIELINNLLNPILGFSESPYVKFLTDFKE